MRIKLNNPRLRYLAALELLALKNGRHFSRRVLYRRAAKKAENHARVAWVNNLCTDSYEMAAVADALLKASFSID